jgi:hypothetical protein
MKSKIFKEVLDSCPEGTEDKVRRYAKEIMEMNKLQEYQKDDDGNPFQSVDQAEQYLAHMEGAKVYFETIKGKFSADVIKCSAYTPNEVNYHFTNIQPQEEQLKELTIERIEEFIPWITTEQEDPVFHLGAKWAKRESDAYWKAKMIEELEKALELVDWTGEGLSKKEEYIKELKAKYGIV